MTKKILIALAALLAGCATGCSTGAATNAIPDTKATVVVTTPSADVEADEPDTSAEDMFVLMLPGIAKETPTSGEWYELKRLGKNTCDAIGRGVGKDDLITLLLSEGISPNSRTGRLTMAAMVVATETYCPEYSGFFKA